MRRVKTRWFGVGSRLMRLPTASTRLSKSFCSGKREKEKENNDRGVDKERKKKKLSKEGVNWGQKVKIMASLAQ